MPPATRRHATRRRDAGAGLLAVALLLAAAGDGLRAQVEDDPAARQQAESLLAEAFPGGAPATRDGRELFLAVLGSHAFLHADAGPFDLYARSGPGQAADRLLAAAAAGLAPAGQQVQRDWGAGADTAGLVAGRRHPLVLLESAAEFERVLALLDHCEDLGFSGWKPQNAVWSRPQRLAEVARTWEVQLFNLSHPLIAERRKEWLAHGIGYYSLAHLVNRAVRLGAWGLSPPWFDQGLIDELDIAAYGKAWVGGESWTAETSGWFRPGWSGFLPQGAAPPPPPVGPPLELGVTVKRTGNAWDDRGNSPARHWNELVQDRRSAAPASFAFMAEHQSFLPRDRAYARCALHLLLASAHDGGRALLASLDRPAEERPDGMPSSEPLTLLVAQALGGVPEVDRLESLPLAELLSELKRPEVAGRLAALKAEGLLALSDHREQSGWLYARWKGELTDRTELFRLILELEHEQQLLQWAAIGRHLDRGMDAALAARKTFPKADGDRARVLAAFRGALEQPATTADGSGAGGDR